MPTMAKPHIPTLVLAILAALVLLGLYHLIKK